MKKGLIFVVMFIFLLGFVSAAQVIEDLHFQDKALVNVVGYDPFPVTPGHYFDLHVKLQNMDGRDIGDVRLEIVEDFPFSAYGENGKTVVSLRKNEQVFVDFRIKVDEKVIEGDNELRLRYVTPKGSWISEPLTIKIQELEASLGVDAVRLEPENFNQGEVGKIVLVLHNYALGFVKDVTLDLGVDETVFTPVGSLTEKKVRALSGGEVKEVEFDLMVSADADSKAYKLPLTISYYDASGTALTVEDYVGILVGAKPAYRLDVEDSTVFTKGIGDVVISISNVGASEMRYLALELEETSDYDVVSSNRVQLGNLDSDDFETAEFKIYSKRTSAYPLKVKVIYNDAYNQGYVDANDVHLKMFSSRKATQYGLKQSQGSFLNVLLFLVLLFFVYRVYKDWRTRRDLEESVKYVSRHWYRWGRRKVTDVKQRAIKKVRRKRYK